MTTIKQRTPKPISAMEKRLVTYCSQRLDKMQEELNGNAVVINAMSKLHGEQLGKLIYCIDKLTDQIKELKDIKALDNQIKRMSDALEHSVVALESISKGLEG